MKPTGSLSRCDLPIVLPIAFLLGACVAICAESVLSPLAPTNVPAGETDAPTTVVITARRWAEPLQSVPGAVTVQTAESLQAAGVTDIREASRTVPNLTLGDFTVRRLTFPYVRGIGSGRNSPAVTLYLDGVPQLSYATASQELLGIDRIEFLRGPQGALYGRNTLGGAINVVPRMPTRDPAASATLSAGDHGYFDSRASAEGPAGPGHAAGSVSGGYSTREGFTKNDITGHRIDDREAFFGRAQVLWPDVGPWTFRLSAGGERDRDGDYALGDLAALRQRPYRVAHDFEGSSARDLAQPVFTASRRGQAADLTSVTAFQWWHSHDRTDLDMTPADLIRRDNREAQQAWIEELRLTSPEAAPVRLGSRVDLRWLLGAFVVRSDYTQRAFSDYRPGAVPALGIPFPFQQHEDADLDDTGASLYGQITLTLDQRLELGLGLREDYEHRSAQLRSHANPPLMPASGLEADRDFSQTSPRATLGYHVTPDSLAYVGVSKGYKAGGFNAQPVPGHTSFSEETSWSCEAGLKTAWLRDRIVANGVLFWTEWDDLQLDVPAGAPGVFYIDNTGKARSQGGEVELITRPLSGLSLFGGVGLLDSEFRGGSVAGGGDVSGNDLPFAPHITWHAGTEYTQPLRGQLHGFLRIECVGTGRYYYDAANRASQGDYTLMNARLGVATGAWRVEGWVDNIFDTDYVPIAFPYSLAPSGYVGENGAPRLVGISFTRSF